jgi:prophage regulatory protein
MRAGESESVRGTENPDATECIKLQHSSGPAHVSLQRVRVSEIVALGGGSRTLGRRCYESIFRQRQDEQMSNHVRPHQRNSGGPRQSVPEANGPTHPHGSEEGQSVRLNILRLPEVKRMTGLSRSTLYELQAVHRFPHAIKISARSVGWIESEVQEWIARRAELSRRRV